MDGRGARTFGQLLRAEEEEGLSLMGAALAIAADEFPGLDAEACLAEVDAMASAVRARLPPGASQRQVVEALNAHLFVELGFRGNLEDYYDPHNSYINRVLERRLGIPITLSLLYIEVGQRLGLPMVGVGLPGHFVVKVAGADEEILIDPFYQGAILDRAECQRRLDAIYGGRVVLSEQFLRAVGKRELLARLLYNLKRIHARADDLPRAIAVVEKLLLLQPYALEDMRDRGMLFYKAKRYREALDDLRAYLRYLPSARDAASVRRTIQACERLSATRP